MLPPLPERPQEIGAVSQTFEYGAPVEPAYPVRGAPHIIPAIPGQTLSIHMEPPPPAGPLKQYAPSVYEAPPVLEVSQDVVEQPSPGPETPPSPQPVTPTEQVPSQPPPPSPEPSEEPPPTPISIPYLLDIKQVVKAPEDVKSGFASSISSIQIQSPKNVKIVPIPVPKFVEPKKTKTEEEVVKAGNVEFYGTDSRKFSPQIKDPNVVRNALLHSADQTDDQIQGDGRSVEAKPQEGGWEIIPATQYDITHLFNNVKIPEDGSPGEPLPVPVPISIPASPPPQSPLFVVAERIRGSAEPGVETSPETSNQVVQSSATEEPELQKLPEQPPHPAAQPAVVAQPVEAQPSDTSSVGMPMAPQFRQPQELQQQIRYDQLQPSIVTALHHAQRTAFLTHSHLADREPAPKGVVYVDSVPMRQEIPVGRVVPTGQVQPGAAPVQLVRVMSPDQIPFNCSGSPIIPAQGPVKPFGNGRTPYLLYYPTSVQPSSVYWAEQASPPPGAQYSGPLPPSVLSSFTPQVQQPAGSESMLSAPIFRWSQKLVPASNSLLSQTLPSPAGEGEQPEIPSTRKPFDIITVGQEPTIKEPEEVQSLGK